MAASAAWYEKLGFAMEHRYAPEGEPCWAWLSSGPGGAQLMLTKANPPVDPHSQGVLFYLYYDDVQAAHAQAGAAGQMAAIVCVLDEAKVDAALDAVFAVVRRQIGFVTVSDVAVIRSERF